MIDPYSSNPLTPYAAPGSPIGTVDARVVDALQGTKPWVRLCAVIGFIGTGFMLLAAIAMGIGGTVIGLTAKESMPFAGFPVVIAVVYAVIGVLYLFPSLKLWQYGSAIVRLMNSQSPDDLVAALEQQRSFWKFVGIMVIAFIALYVVIIIVAVLVGIIGAASSGKFM